MLREDQPVAWQVDANESYIPIKCDGAIVGFCKPEFATQIATAMNHDDQLRKALYLACYDLISRSGGGKHQVDDLVEKYLAKTEPPKRGTGLIAVLLKQRQAELDLNNDEFARFCDTYRLSRAELRNIWAGQDIEQNQLGPLSRILGQSIDEVIDAWKGADLDSIH